MNPSTGEARPSYISFGTELSDTNFVFTASIGKPRCSSFCVRYD